MKIEISEYEMLVLWNERRISLSDLIKPLLPVVMTETRDPTRLLVILDIGILPPKQAYVEDANRRIKLANKYLLSARKILGKVRFW